MRIFSEWFHVIRSRTRSMEFFILNSNREASTTMGDQSFVLNSRSRLLLLIPKFSSINLYQDWSEKNVIWCEYIKEVR